MIDFAERRMQRMNASEAKGTHPPKPAEKTIPVGAANVGITENALFSHSVEVEVTGDYGLFTDPALRLGGEKSTLQVPTYEALKGIMNSAVWKPTFTWFIDEVRIMNPIQMESKGIRTIKYNGGQGDLCFYTYLKNCRYQIRAHYEWNLNRPEFKGDRKEDKFYEFIHKSIEKGGRRDIFLGTRECQGYIEPCEFGSGAGYYDNLPELSFGVMYHGITYPDEAYSSATKGKMTVNLWKPVMKNGVIRFLRPEECPAHKPVRNMEMKKFENKLERFPEFGKFQEVT